MPPGDVSSTDLLAADTADLPDWLTGSDAALEPPLLAGLTGLDLPAEPEPLGAAALSSVAASDAVTPPPAVTPMPIGNEARDGWNVVRQDVTHNPSAPPGFRSYQFNVTNASRVDAYECMVELALPLGCKQVRARRSPKRTRHGLEWNLGVLAPGEVVPLLVRVPLDAGSRGLLQKPVPVQIATRRTAPLLVVTAEAPSAAPVGHPVPLALVLENRGRGVLKGGRLDVTLDPIREPVAEATFPDVAPNSEYRTQLQLVPKQAGPSRWRVTAKSADFPPVQATVELVARLTELSVAVTAPARVELDDEFACVIAVSNAADTPAIGVRVALPVPEELVFRGATAGGALCVTGDRVEWVIPELPPRGKWETSAKLIGFAPGHIRLASSVAGIGVRAVAEEVPLHCDIRRSAIGATLGELLAGVSLPAPTSELAPRAPSIRATGERHLVLRTAKSRIAIPLPNVRDVLRQLPLTTLPGTPEWVVGVTNVRGDIVTVIDLAGFLELGEPTGHRGLVIVHDPSGLVLGLLVDEVTGIRPVASDVESPIENRLSRFLDGVGVDSEGVVHRLAIPELLAALESELCEQTPLT